MINQNPKISHFKIKRKNSNSQYHKMDLDEIKN